MGTTPDGPAAHIMVVTWPNGMGTSTSTETCDPEIIPPPQDPPIPVTGEAFIIPVTGLDVLKALAEQQQVLITAGAALVGVSLMIGARKKRK